MGNEEGVLHFFADFLEAGRHLFCRTLAVDEVDTPAGQLTAGSQHCGGVVHKTDVTALAIAPVAGTMNLVFAVLGFAVMLIKFHECQQLVAVRLVPHDEDAVVLLPIAGHRGTLDGGQWIEPDDLNQRIELFPCPPPDAFFRDGGTDFRGPEGVQIQMHHELGVLGDVGFVDFCRLAGGQVAKARPNSVNRVFFIVLILN